MQNETEKRRRTPLHLGCLSYCARTTDKLLCLTGTLSDQEMRDGITTFGLHLSDNEIDLISKFMNDVGVNGELTCAMFKDLVKAAEMELPEPGEFACTNTCFACALPSFASFL